MLLILKRVIFVLLLVLPGLLWADTVLLKNGSSVSGRIINQNRSEIEINVNGIVQKINKSDVKRVEYGLSAAERQKKEQERLRRIEEERRRQEEARRAEEKRIEEEKARQAEEQRVQEEERKKAEESVQIENQEPEGTDSNSETTTEEESGPDGGSQSEEEAQSTGDLENQSGQDQDQESGNLDEGNTVPPPEIQAVPEGENLIQETTGPEFVLTPGASLLLWNPSIIENASRIPFSNRVVDLMLGRVSLSHVPSTGYLIGTQLELAGVQRLASLEHGFDWHYNRTGVPGQTVSQVAGSRYTGSGSDGTSYSLARLSESMETGGEGLVTEMGLNYHLTYYPFQESLFPSADHLGFTGFLGIRNQKLERDSLVKFTTNRYYGTLPLDLSAYSMPFEMESGKLTATESQIEIGGSVVYDLILAPGHGMDLTFSILRGEGNLDYNMIRTGIRKISGVAVPGTENTRASGTIESSGYGLDLGYRMDLGSGGIRFYGGGLWRTTRITRLRLVDPNGGVEGVLMGALSGGSVDAGSLILAASDSLDSLPVTQEKRYRFGVGYEIAF